MTIINSAFENTYMSCTIYGAPYMSCWQYDSLFIGSYTMSSENNQQFSVSEILLKFCSFLLLGLDKRGERILSDLDINMQYTVNISRANCMNALKYAWSRE